jgi:hypothetical protein
MPAELFWEMHQQRRITQAGKDATKAKSKVDRLEGDVSYLKRKVERLALASQALWELLRDHTDFEEEHILQKMQEIDLRDGAEDGKIGHKPIACPQCSRVSNSARQTCIYCGTSLHTVREHVFE